MENFVGMSLIDVSVSAASGDTANIDVRAFKYVSIDATLKGLSGGTAPTVLFTLFRRLPNGLYLSVAAFGAALSANGTQSLHVGPGMSTAQCPGHYMRIGWVTTGTPTTALLDVSVAGGFE